jgi:hypothetical protein
VQQREHQGALTHAEVVARRHGVEGLHPGDFGDRFAPCPSSRWGGDERSIGVCGGFRRDCGVKTTPRGRALGARFGLQGLPETDPDDLNAAGSNCSASRRANARPV